MTTKDFAKKLDSQLKQISDAKFLLTCVSDAHAKQVKRIFNDGLNSQGGKIGQYNNTDPIYINPNQSPKKFQLKGKSGKTSFKNGKNHKTGYFDSYKAFRQAISREASFVNLRLTENLKFDFTNSLMLSGNTYITGVKRSENTDKVNGHIQKYGVETYTLSKSEKEQFRQCVINKLNAVLSN